MGLRWVHAVLGFVRFTLNVVGRRPLPNSARRAFSICRTRSAWQTGRGRRGGGRVSAPKRLPRAGALGTPIRSEANCNLPVSQRRVPAGGTFELARILTLDKPAPSFRCYSGTVWNMRYRIIAVTKDGGEGGAASSAAEAVVKLLQLERAGHENVLIKDKDDGILTREQLLLAAEEESYPLETNSMQREESVSGRTRERSKSRDDNPGGPDK
jgi:hypothetical protein